ncbi:MAG: DUF4442 domain-containing protein [Myxococcales bacterium]|nr:MAG: DUF4442 domain-containing protein [Myxococcales bacterium]
MSPLTTAVSPAPGNRLARAVALVERLPGPVRAHALTAVFRSQVPFVGTAGLQLEALTSREAVVTVKNRRGVQNHIHGVHAAAMALLAETATGAVFSMSVPDTAVPLLRSMHVDFVKRATGALRAVATLTAEQRSLVASTPRGDTVVAVSVTDEAGATPISVTMTWAWAPKKRG